MPPSIVASIRYYSLRVFLSLTQQAQKKYVGIQHNDRESPTCQDGTRAQSGYKSKESPADRERRLCGCEALS